MMSACSPVTIKIEMKSHRGEDEEEQKRLVATKGQMRTLSRAFHFDTDKVGI